MASLGRQFDSPAGGPSQFWKNASFSTRFMLAQYREEYANQVRIIRES